MMQISPIPFRIKAAMQWATSLNREKGHCDREARCPIKRARATEAVTAGQMEADNR